MVILDGGDGCGVFKTFDFIRFYRVFVEIWDF